MKIISKARNKISLTVHVDNTYTRAKSIFIDCNKAAREFFTQFARFNGNGMHFFENK
jgi:hypothetical protein